MTNKEMVERFRATIDQFYNFPSQRYVEENQLQFIGGVLQTALHLLPDNDYYDLKNYIFARWGYNAGGVDRQMNIDEWLVINNIKTKQIDFETFRDYCKHQSGSIKFGDDEEASRGCTFKDEKPATCWDDWQKCNEQNCPFMKKMKGEL